MSELLKYAIIVLAAFSVQLVLLFLTANRFRFLRLAVPVLAAATGVVFFLAAILTGPPGWGLILLPLVALFVFLGLGLVLMGWGLAWFVYYLTQHLTKRKASDT